MQPLLLFLSLISLPCIAFAQDGKPYDIPTRCQRKVECPKYKVLSHNSQKDFEIRQYDDASLVWLLGPTVSLPTQAYKSALDSYLPILERYTGGLNDRNATIPWTAPLITDIKPVPDPSAVYYSIFFYIPPQLQKDPPQLEGLFVTFLPFSKHVAAKRFKGTIQDAIIADELNALRKNLEDTPWKASEEAKDVFAVADYTHPSETEDQVFEVMVYLQPK